MKLSLLSVLAVLGCFGPQALGILPAATPTLQYVFAVFRHGPRSPLHRHYKSHVNTLTHKQTFVGLRGVLTAFGKQKMYDVGLNLRDRYATFLGNYREDRVWVTSRGASRNVMTCLAIMAGLLPPRKPILDEVLLPNWQPIPPFATKDDKAYMFHDLEFKNLDDCKPYKASADKLNTEVLHKEQWDRPIFKLLRRVTGNEDLNSIFAAYKVYDSLHSEAMNGIPLPAWALQKQPDFQDKPLYPTLLREVVEEWTNYDLAITLLNLYIEPFFNTIKTKMTLKATNERFQELMHFHVTEDMTLMALVKLLRINEDNVYEPGNGLIMEVHYDVEWIVKFFVYDSHTYQHNMYEIMPGFLSQPRCPLKKLLGITLTPTWPTACGFA